MKKEIIYNKLIRDNIPRIIEKAGHEYIIRIADDAEYINKLIEKVSEELKEFTENPCEEEMANIFEVLDSLIKVYKLDKNEINKVKE
jgi:predicted house-cleaning noncanonical NTP pyrophosphatase (MazG superfamily)